jgi:DNA-binding transcriptional ArsR family regulator
MVQGSLVEVIAEPTRRRILDQLLGGELPVAALVERLQQSQPTVSKHLRVLRDADLVSVRVDGQRRMYQLRPEPLMELDAWLEPYRQMWRDSLDKLEQQLSTRRPQQVRRRKR